MLSCEEGGTPPPPPPAGRAVVLNEIDYDQVGTDGDGFVELRNNGAEAADLAGLALVLVDGSDGLEYDREPLTGTLASGSASGGRDRGAERVARRRRARRHRHRRAP